MQLLELVPVFVSLFYLMAYPAYSKALKGKLSSERFFTRVWLLAPLLVIWAYSYDLVIFVIVFVLSLPILYFFVIKDHSYLDKRLGLLAELALSVLEAFLYYRI